MATPLPQSTTRLGRPSREEQARRREALLEAALDIFLDRGFEGATVDEIAARVGMSKRTIYAQHRDKAALFRAAIGRAVGRYTIITEELEAVASDDLRDTLAAIGRLRIANIADPTVTKLQRILSSQSHSSREMLDFAFEEGAGPTILFLTRLFERTNAAGETAITDPRRGATAYLSLVVGGPARSIVLGSPLGAAEIDRHIAFAVDIFLNGAGARRTA